MPLAALLSPSLCSTRSHASGEVAGRHSLLAELRGRIAAVERPDMATHLAAPHREAWRQTLPTPPSWTLGVEALDARLGGGLDVAGLHEVKPAHPVQGRTSMSTMAAALAFLLRLLVRRQMGVADEPPRPVLWCWSGPLMSEIGHPFAPGLAAVGLDPGSLLLVTGGKRNEVLWSLEEGLASRGLSLVVGCLDHLDLTPARRLSLAAAAAETPCLVLTGAGSAVAAATASRWRIAPAPSAPHPFDAEAPGALRLAVTLERCRAHVFPEVSPLLLEWSDATHDFRLAAALADRAVAAPRSPGHPPRSALRAR